MLKSKLSVTALSALALAIASTSSALAAPPPMDEVAAKWGQTIQSGDQNCAAFDASSNSCNSLASATVDGENVTWLSRTITISEMGEITMNVTHTEQLDNGVHCFQSVDDVTIESKPANPAISDALQGYITAANQKLVDDQTCGVYAKCSDGKNYALFYAKGIYQSTYSREMTLIPKDTELTLRATTQDEAVPVLEFPSACE